VRGCRLALSEIMTILIHFHPSHYRDFKAYYWLHVCRHLANDFPNRLSDNRLVAVIPTVLMPLCVYLHTRQGQATGIAFITKRRKTRRNKLLPLADKLLLRQRALIETINDQLKNISQIEPTRHRSVSNCMVNLLAGLVAYTHQPKKPSLNLSQNQLKRLNYQA
jgi:hypothetical protein